MNEHEWYVIVRCGEYSFLKEYDIVLDSGMGPLSGRGSWGLAYPHPFASYEAAAEWLNEQP